MCRLLAYLGPQAVSLHELMLAPEHALARQAFAPRMQAHGRMNADGFGVGWYEPAVRAEPARYRRAVPIWTDRSFESFAPVIRSSVVLAALRNASPGLAVDESNTAPYTAGLWLMAHNGAIDGFTDGVGETLRRTIAPERARQIQGSTDSEVLFAMTLDRMDAGARPPDALADAIGTVKEHADGRLNVVMTDGRTIVASRCGDTLFAVRDRFCAGSLIVASEPFDDLAGWDELPDLSIVEAVDDSFEVKPL